MDSSSGPQPNRGFDGRSVLVIEDEYFLADDLRKELESRGAKVVGPIADFGSAQEQVAHDDFDVAVIDIKLGCQLAWSIADVLMRKNIPFGFFTGYGAGAIPQRFRHIKRWQKPCDMSKLAEDVRLLCLEMRVARQLHATREQHAGRLRLFDMNERFEARVREQRQPVDFTSFSLPKGTPAFKSPSR